MVIIRIDRDDQTFAAPGRARHGLHRCARRPGRGAAARLEGGRGRIDAPLSGAHPVRYQRHREGGRRLHQGGAGPERHPGPDSLQGSRAPQRGGAAQRLRTQASAPVAGSHRHRDGGRREVAFSAVQCHARRGLCLRARRHRRQGQPDCRTRDHDPAEAAERAARSRRHPARRVGRRGRLEPRHRLHDGRALPRDRCRVLHRRGRRHDSRARGGALCHRAGHREGGEGRRADGPRGLGPRIRTAQVEPDRASRERRRPLHDVAARRP